jgi:hypothetical protein
MKASQVSHRVVFSCLRKKSFSKKAADAAIERLAEQKKLYFYYKCELCGAFHLTSKEPIGRQFNVL